MTETDGRIAARLRCGLPFDRGPSSTPLDENVKAGLLGDCRLRWRGRWCVFRYQKIDVRTVRAETAFTKPLRMP